MASAKKLNESNFSRLVKDMNAAGELIRTHQDEKQAVLDEFEQEKKRFKDGKISQKTLASSSTKTNKELMRLDKFIRDAMKKVETLSSRIKALGINQAPKPFRVAVSGIKLNNSKKKVKAKKAAPKKKSAAKETTKKKTTAKKKSPAKKKKR